MRLTFQADADLNQQIVSATVRLEPALDFKTATAAGLAGMDDLSVLGEAARRERILVTHDLRTMPDHFGRFVQEKTSWGVIVVRQHLPVALVAGHLVLLWSTTTPEEWTNRFYVVPV